jgi:uncharacterized membrane protein
MKHTDLVIRSAVASLLAVGLATAGSSAFAAKDEKGNMEKCAGIAKAGKNDCGTSKHACSGQSKTDGGEEWVYVPKGACEKIVGGALVASKK